MKAAVQPVELSVDSHRLKVEAEEKTVDNLARLHDADCKSIQTHLFDCSPCKMAAIMSYR